MPVHLNIPICTVTFSDNPLFNDNSTPPNAEFSHPVEDHVALQEQLSGLGHLEEVHVHRDVIPLPPHWARAHRVAARHQLRDEPLHRVEDDKITLLTVQYSTGTAARPSF